MRPWGVAGDGNICGRVLVRLLQRRSGGQGMSSDGTGEPRRPFKWKATGEARLCIGRRRGAEFLRLWGVAGDENICGRVLVQLFQQRSGGQGTSP